MFLHPDVLRPFFNVQLTLYHYTMFVRMGHLKCWAESLFQTEIALKFMRGELYFKQLKLI